MQIDRPIAIALILFVILLLLFFLVVPEYKTFVSLQSDLGQKKAEFNAEFDYYAAISRIYFDLQSRQDDIKKIDDALPQNPDLGEIVYFFQLTAKQNGLVAKNLFLSKTPSVPTGSEAQSSGKVKDITFSISLSGDYPSLEGFISSLERSSRIFEVSNVSFESETGAPYTFNLQVKTHSY